jgi:hypothetical protein
MASSVGGTTSNVVSEGRRVGGVCGRMGDFVKTCLSFPLNVGIGGDLCCSRVGGGDGCAWVGGAGVCGPVGVAGFCDVIDVVC